MKNSRNIRKFHNFFQGSDDVHSQFMAKFIPENETVAVIASASPMQTILPASYNIQTLDFTLKKRLRKCDPDISRMTPCIMKSYNGLYGQNYNQIVNRYINLSDTTFSGIEGLETLTGCKQPCNTVEYHSSDYIKYHKTIARDDSTKIFNEIGQNTSAALVVIHTQKRTIQKDEESLKYTGITFISDVGGILGIFLGISFWSIHSTVIVPLFTKFFKKKESNHVVPFNKAVSEMKVELGVIQQLRGQEEVDGWSAKSPRMSTQGTEVFP